MEDFYPVLHRIRLFRGVGADDLAQMLRCLNARKTGYEKNEMVLLEGQPATAVGIVLSGTLQILREDFLGNRSIMTEIAPGELFAESFALAGEQKLPVTVLSVTASEVLWIEAQRLVSPCENTCPFHTRLMENMLFLLASKNTVLNRKIGYLSRRSTREKLLAYLSDQTVRQGKNDFEIPFNRQELADYLCVDRSALSSELRRLKEEGILLFHKNRFCLLKKD